MILKGFTLFLPVFLKLSIGINWGSGCFVFNVFISSSSNGAQTPSSPDTLPFQENGRSGFVLFFAHGERDRSWQHRSLGHNQPTADRYRSLLTLSICLSDLSSTSRCCTALVLVSLSRSLSLFFGHCGGVVVPGLVCPSFGETLQSCQPFASSHGGQPFDSQRPAPQCSLERQRTLQRLEQGIVAARRRKCD